MSVVDGHTCNSTGLSGSRPIVERQAECPACQKLSGEWVRKIERFCAALQKSVPLLTEYAPAEWKSFRDGAPDTLRYGIFYQHRHATDQVAFKTRLRTVVAAEVCRNQICSVLTCSAMPMVAAEDSGYAVEFWIDRRMMVDLTDAIDPQPEREWRSFIRSNSSSEGRKL